MTLSKKQILDWYQELGVDCFLNTRPQCRIEMLQKEVPNKLNNTYYSHNTGPVEIARKVANRCNQLVELREAITNFNYLDVKKVATNTVFADGNQESDIMLIGEAPGINEDKCGIPFCGQSGKLLDNILSAIQINRTQCYITNVMFWRPPCNRRPTKDEISICKPFVEKHISLIKPKIIILVGSTAVESLLNLKISMGQLRKQIFQYSNQYLVKCIDTFVIFHPSYLLRQPSQKKNMWSDIQKIFSFYKKIPQL